MTEFSVTCKKTLEENIALLKDMDMDMFKVMIKMIEEHIARLKDMDMDVWKEMDEEVARLKEVERILENAREKAAAAEALTKDINEEKTATVEEAAAEALTATVEEDAPVSVTN